jgi:hypothetical protein
MRWFASIVIAAVLITAAPAAGAFDDVPPAHPFADEIAWMEAMDIAGGYADGNFHPTRPVTRQAMAAFLQRYWDLPGSPSPPDPGFNDVGPDHPFYDAIAWMAAEGLAEGYADGGFHPTARVSRQAAAAFLCRLLCPDSWPVPGSPTFADVPSSHTFYDEIEWLAEQGIITGFSDGTFRPTAPVSRQAAAAFLFRAFDHQTGGICTDQTQIPVTECAGLVVLHSVMGGAGWDDDTGWLTAAPPCSWFGVDCFMLAGQQHVVFLNLSENGLSGRIPTQIDALPLASLMAFGNELTGGIPEDLTAMDLVTLVLSDNDLSGPIPVVLADMSSLEVLGLGGNGCLTAATPELIEFLDQLDPDWDDGCVAAH